ncbi:hypothetical protein [Algoriphagus aquimarinus]|jgi:hypothetical protein|uniref:Uncharacterized protein n=1 Tax=Algoriphagus aquimarinus TaxID=237018 RepID=A0A5C7B6B9_9BACT|nr:hypothetical protein [Algoriphagus aquimarinus]TXE14115.1 hypothetical protein ESV85_00725 [Algoriphagus aquimarinus]
MSTENKLKAFKLLLHDYAEAVSSNQETATDFLKKEGVDVNRYVTSGIKEIRKSTFLRKAQVNMERDESLMEKALVLLKQKIEENLSLTGNMLVGMLRKKAPNVQFRSLDKLDDEEIREILSNVDLAKLMEELEKRNEI